MVNDILRDVKKGLGISFGIMLGFSFLFLAYAFVEPSSAPSTDNYVSASSKLVSIETNTNDIETKIDSVTTTVNSINTAVSGLSGGSTPSDWSCVVRSQSQLISNSGGTLTVFCQGNERLVDSSCYKPSSDAYLPKYFSGHGVVCYSGSYGTISAYAYCCS